MALRTLLALLLAAPAGALEPADPLLITASRWPQRGRETSREVVSLDADELAKRMPRTVSEAFRDEPGVLVQQSFPGHVALWSRGHIGRSNLLLVDGVRVNHAGTENLQSLNLVDVEALESLELMRGPGSVLYGPDAQGGVVYAVQRRRRDYSKPSGGNGRLAGAYRTANNGTHGRLELEGNRGGFGILAGATARRYEDLNPGGSLPKAAPSGYLGWSADVAADWKAPVGTWRATYQRTEQSDVPRYQQYVSARRFGSVGSFVEHSLDLELRELIALEGAFEPGRAASSLSAKAWAQRQETRARQQSAGTTQLQLRRNVTETLGFRLETVSDPASFWRVIYGADIYQDRIHSGRENVALLTGVRTNDDSNADFPDGSRFGNAGAFLLNRFAAGERWAFELGGRVNRNWSDSLLRTGIFNGHEFYDKNDSVSGGAGATFQAHETVQLTAGAWSGFRPPNLSETVALRTGAANGADVPVAGLRPERTYGFEAGVRHRAKRVRQTLSLYHVLIRDGIERVAGTYLGRNFIDTNGNGTKQANEPLVFQKKNVSAGYVQGFEWKGEADLTDAYTLFGAASHAYGRDSDARVALSRMPPLMGLAGLRWTGAGAKKPWAEFYSRMAARQRRLAPSDLTDATIDPNGSPGWTTFNLRAGLRPLENLRATATLENITDKGYREHASGIDAPGFDAGLRLELFF